METHLKAFLLRYPQFESNGYDTEQIEQCLQDARLEVSQRRWGRLYERGLYALTAHFLTLAQQAQAGSHATSLPVASETAGQLSVSYASTGASRPDEVYLASTIYGQEYLRLQRTFKIGVMVVRA